MCLFKFLRVIYRDIFFLGGGSDGIMITYNDNNNDYTFLYVFMSSKYVCESF